MILKISIVILWIIGRILIVILVLEDTDTAHMDTDSYRKDTDTAHIDTSANKDFTNNNSY